MLFTRFDRNMIIKMMQAMDWRAFRHRYDDVKAARINEDFIFETARGWVQGYKGQWLIEDAERQRQSSDDGAFLRSFIPIKGDSGGADDRREGLDRRGS